MISGVLIRTMKRIRTPRMSCQERVVLVERNWVLDGLQRLRAKTTAILWRMEMVGKLIVLHHRSILQISLQFLLTKEPISMRSSISTLTTPTQILGLTTIGMAGTPTHI